MRNIPSLFTPKTEHPFLIIIGKVLEIYIKMLSSFDKIQSFQKSIFYTFIITSSNRRELSINH